MNAARPSCCFAGAAEFIAGAPESSLAWAKQALPIYERLGDTLGIARTLHGIAEALRDLGDFERSAELFARSIEIRRKRTRRWCGHGAQSRRPLSRRGRYAGRRALLP